MESTCQIMNAESIRENAAKTFLDVYSLLSYVPVVLVNHVYREVHTMTYDLTKFDLGWDN